MHTSTYSNNFSRERVCSMGHRKQLRCVLCWLTGVNVCILHTLQCDKTEIVSQPSIEVPGWLGSQLALSRYSSLASTQQKVPKRLTNRIEGSRQTCIQVSGPHCAALRSAKTHKIQISINQKNKLFENVIESQ